MDLKLLGAKSLQMGRCDPNWILCKLCNKHLIAFPYVIFIKMSFILFYFVFFAKLEVEMNHYDGWSSKGSPLKIKVVVKKDINREMQGEVGKDSSINESLKRATCLKLSGRRS
jgi:hypothetical protein